MSCIRRRTKFHLIYSDSISLNNSEINFKISDQNKGIYFCRLFIEDFIRIIVQKEIHDVPNEECNGNDLTLDKNIKFTLIKNNKNGYTIIKLIYKPLKIRFFFENCPILDIKIIKSNETIYMYTTFFSIRNLYGLAERASHSKLRNKKTYRLYNTDEFVYAIKSDKPLYGSVPLLIGLFKYHNVGLLWKNTSDTWVKLRNKAGLISGGKTVAKWWSETGETEIVCHISKHMLGVHKLFMSTTGFTPLPPLFALGYHQCRWNYDDQEDVIQVDGSMDKAGIPYDTIWLDIEHTDGKRYMTWDTEKFNPQEILDYLKEKNRHLVVIIDPHLKVDDDYEIYKEAKHNDYLIKNEDGSVFVGEGWPKDSSWIDFINDDACTWWSKKIENYLMDLKCTATHNNLWIWNDMNEPSVLKCPDNQLKPTAKHAKNVSHRDVHNIYGQNMAKSTWEGILNATGKHLRPFLLSRSFYTGSQKYGAIWTGDTAASWEYLQISVAMMISLSICGIDFCGSDVGGFFGNPDFELLTRWYQLGTLQPFFRAHSHIESKRREPYLIEDPYGSIIKTAILLRYRLLAYWYLCFWLAESNGEPVISPIWMYYPYRRHTENDDMFMIGSDILARPIVTSNCTSISMILPDNGNFWYQYCDVSGAWKMHVGNRKIKIKVSLKSIPLFYRAGTCIFMKDELCSNTMDWQNCPYNVYIFPFPNRKSTGTLYIDDYCSFSYRTDKHYILYCITFDPVEKSLICTMGHDKLNNTSFINSKIIKIIIIKNKYMSWFDYKTISADGTFVEDCKITHFDDRIEVSNLNLDVLVDSVILFHS